MSKAINEGNIIEGIFAIGIGLLLRDGEINKSELNKIRTEIDPKIFKDGPSEHQIGHHVLRNAKNRTPDVFNVNLVIRMKPDGGVDLAFGKQYIPKYKKMQDIGELSQKIDQIIQNAKADYRGKLLAIRNQFLDNNVGEVVTFTILCDGIAGESTGGSIKGDVFVKIVAATSKGSKVIMEETLSFSLKSNSKTMANLSPYKGFIELMKVFDIKMSKQVESYAWLENFKATTAKEKKDKQTAIRRLFETVSTEFEKKVKGKAESKKAMNYLKKHMFGSDKAHVVEILSNTTKEMTEEYFEVISEKIELVTTTKYAGTKGKDWTQGYIIFKDKKSNGVVFHLRMNIRLDSSGVYKSIKFLVELGGDMSSIMKKK
jgi:hypothetical protein